MLVLCFTKYIHYLVSAHFREKRNAAQPAAEVGTLVTSERNFNGFYCFFLKSYNRNHVVVSARGEKKRYLKVHFFQPSLLCARGILVPGTSIVYIVACFS